MNSPNLSSQNIIAPSRLDALDGLRGFAALTIVIYHLFSSVGGPEWRPVRGINLLRPLHDGWCGVNLFLVISGFCLFWPYARDQQREMNFKDFMSRRARRLLPAYYASLIIVPTTSIFFAHFYDPQFLNLPKGIVDIGLHLFLLHSLWSETIYSINGIAWSLGLEWTWYLFFPIAVWLFRRSGALCGLLILAILTITYRVGLYLYFGPANSFSVADLNWTFTLRSFLVGRLFEFGAGMYTAWWVANRATSPLVLLLSSIAVPCLLSVGHISTGVDVFLPMRDMLYGSAFALLLLVAVSPGRSRVGSFFSSKVMCSIGEYSYSLYLFHMILVTLICYPLRTHGYNNAGTFFAVLFVIPLILWVAKGCYLCFEKPFLAAPRRSRPVVEAKQTLEEGG